MFAQASALRLSRLGIHYGWAVVALTFLASLTTAGAISLPATLILPLANEFGWTTEQISGALALRLLVYGLTAPFAAALIDRFGLRRTIVAAMALTAAGALLTLRINALWQLTLFWGVFVGFGAGLTALSMTAAAATRWFVSRRGLAVGVLAASAAAGQLVFLPLAAWLAERYGWRAALAPPLVGVAIAGVLALLFMADRPADVGQTALGESDKPEPAEAPTPRSALAALAEISGSGAFWILAATFFICGLSTNGLIQTHFVAFCADFDVGAIAAASSLAAMGALDFVGAIGSGWLADRYDNRALLFVYYGLRGLSLLYLPGSTISIFGLTAFTAFYGLDWVATVPPTVRLTASAFGRERAGSAFGWIYAAHMLGAAVAAYGAGYSRSVLQSYLPAFYAAGALCLVAASLAWLIEKRPAAAGAPARAAP